MAVNLFGRDFDALILPMPSWTSPTASAILVSCLQDEPIPFRERITGG